VVFWFLARDSGDQWKVYNARKSFVFRPGNPHKLADKKFSLTNPNNTISCHSSYGSTFGGDCDIRAANACNNHTNSSTNLGYSYSNDTGIVANRFFASEGNFTMKQVKVFHVND
jgi:hypothetical protein